MTHGRSSMRSNRRSLLLGAALLCGMAPFILIQLKPATFRATPPAGEAAAVARISTTVIDAGGTSPLGEAMAATDPRPLPSASNDVAAMEDPAAAPKASEAGSGTALAASPRCRPDTAAFVPFVPDQPSRPSNYVYVRSSGSAIVCVEDAERKSERMTLAQGQGRRFYGTPPFRLASEQPGEVEVFFQGQRVDLRKTGSSVTLKPSKN